MTRVRLLLLALVALAIFFVLLRFSPLPDTPLTLANEVQMRTS